MSGFSKSDSLVASLRDRLGDDQVITDEGVVTCSNRTTFAMRGSNGLIVRPASRSELSDVLRLLHRQGRSFHVSSGGRNWGYGSRVPVQPGCVLIDLSLMKRILNFDPERGLVVLEPGVTFRELNEFLHKNATGFFLNPPSSGCDASVIGNHSQGGLLRSEIVARECAMLDAECVLPNGEITNDDQRDWRSACGVIMSATIVLDRYPPFWRHFEWRVGDRDLVKWLPQIRYLTEESVLEMPPNFYSELRILSTFARSPNSVPGSGRRLKDSELERLKVEHGVASGLLSGVIKADSVDSLMTRKDQIESALPNTSFGAINDAGPYYGGWCDEGAALQSVYWQMQDSEGFCGDPDVDRCGLIWLTPQIPFCHLAVKDCLGILSGSFAQFEFDFPYSIRVFDQRTLCIVASLHFDRSVPGDDRRASQCYTTIKQRIEAYGWRLRREPPVACHVTKPNKPIAAASRLTGIDGAGNFQ